MAREMAMITILDQVKILAAELDNLNLVTESNLEG